MVFTLVVGTVRYTKTNANVKLENNISNIIIFDVFYILENEVFDLTVYVVILSL